MITKYSRIFLTFFLLLVLLVLAGAPIAYGAGLVPCGTSENPRDCTVCDIFRLIDRVLTFTLETLFVVAGILIVWGGFVILTGAGNPAKLNEGKGIILKAVVGIVIALSAWLIIDTVTHILSGSPTIAPWNDVQCPDETPIAPPAPLPGPPATGGATSTGGGTVQPSAGSGATLTETGARSFLALHGITVNHDNPCPVGQTTGCTTLDGVKQSTLLSLARFKENCDRVKVNCAIEISGGTEGGHSTDGTETHANGDKLDLHPNADLDSYIIGSSNYEGTRSDDHAPLYRGADGTLFAREGDHWDITF